ncbi:ribonuclease H-like domain-containing protein [Tanacetum coccineum]|uniref:Ribonuclease H-like domain-containing protein n=1 Tax=Tanacetum coccineum TaxID=301880 RepID=A0ABQ5F9T8_9ASTR
MRNKSDLDTLSKDDLYNNLKVYEAEIKSQSSSSSNSQNVAFVSSDNTSSTNEAVNTAHDVSAASLQGQVSASTYADDVMFSFFVNQSNSPQLDNEDLEQIDTDDLEEMDLKWQMVMLIMMVKRFIKKTGRNLNFNGKETIGFDKTKVECYNCHRRGHFNRECRAPRNQGNRSGDNTRRVVPVETSANALVVTDRMGYDWSYQAEKGPIYFTLMTHSSSGSSSSSSSDTESEVVHSVFNSGESDVDDNPVNDRFKTGEGIHVVPPPYTGNYMPLRHDLSFAGLDDSVFKSAMSETVTSVPETETSISKTSKDIVEKPKTVRPSAPIIEEWDTDNDNNSVFRPKSNLTKLKFTKINFVKYGENVNSVNKENTHRQAEKLVLNNKGRVTGQKEIRPVWNNAQRVNHQNKLTHPHPKRNFVPTAVATKSGQVPVNAVKQNSPRAASSISTARPANAVAPKPKVNDALPITYSYFNAHSPVRRPFNQKSAAKSNNFKEKVNTVRFNNVTTVGPKAVVSTAEGNKDNDVKSSACWIWRPKGNVKKKKTFLLQRTVDHTRLTDFDYGKSTICFTGSEFLTVDAPTIDWEQVLPPRFIRN